MEVKENGEVLIQRNNKSNSAYRININIEGLQDYKEVRKILKKEGLMLTANKNINL